MYCCVIFGESKDNHTKNYLYKCKQNLKPGDIVKVLAKNSIKIALIKCIYEIIPQNIDVNLSKIKHVISKSNKVVDENMGKSFLLALPLYENRIVTALTSFSRYSKQKTFMIY